MEWSKNQQLIFLCQSAVAGGMIGGLFDVVSGWYRGPQYRSRLFVADAALGAIAAIITFFGALTIMDGHLHPLLFTGVVTGFLVEHYTIGRCLAHLISRIHRTISYMISWCIRCGREAYKAVLRLAKNGKSDQNDIARS